MKTNVPYGGWPILLTPFTPEGSIDWQGLDQVLEFYINRQVPGLLALGQASEVLALRPQECFEIALRIVDRCQGRIFLVAVGNYGMTLIKQAESLTRMARMGINVPVVAFSLLPSADNLDQQLLQLAEWIDPSIYLGI
jgi:4-hydroxy-tetrahydrodipicolinate synthase